MDRYPFMNAVAQPILIKDGELYLVADSGGEIPPGSMDGFGLFYRDTRYLSSQQLRICGTPLMILMASSASQNGAVVELSNEDFQISGRQMPKQLIGVRWERHLDGKRLVLREKLLTRSFAKEEVRLALELTLCSAFEDILQLRGASPRRRGELDEAVVERDRTSFVYRGADGIERRLTADFSGTPSLTVLGRGFVQATFNLALSPREIYDIRVELQIEESGRARSPTIRPVKSEQRAPSGEDPVASAEIETDDVRLNQVMAQSFRDMHLLTTRFDHRFIAGGLPWFVSPFARDSAIAAIQMLPFAPDLAADVARQLAARQGRHHDSATGEEQGKIPHELRFGEMANLGEIDKWPSYHSIDATPLFLILIHEHYRWTGSPTFVRELKPGFNAALQWLLRALEHGSGYVRYTGTSNDGLQNAGWKDSGESIIRRDGSLPRPPIALCEVQGYAFAALNRAAVLLRALGDGEFAGRAEQEAEALRQRFNRDFWMDRETCFALALEQGDRRVDSVTSNAGQVLWSGIADPDKAAATCQRLARADMWSGWGIRTLSNLSPAYNPIHYHLGSVWPFDNSLILAGMRRYGADAAACSLFDDVSAAIAHFNHGRAPEFYVGLEREPGLPPARCPLAEPLQAWSAGAVPFMLLRLLGLERAAHEGEELLLVRPQLPQSIARVKISGLQICGRTAALEVHRSGTGRIELLSAEGATVRISGD